ncbi:MAG: hypothetical protein NUV94_00835 [Candidatus Acetothermia bacterium]|jgi:flavodoxin|nr:hypothetical protein [Candidatus Acetothermia bacterium]
MTNRIRVVFASRTGNTRKVADAIAQAVGGELVDVRKSPHCDLSQAGFLFVGDGVYMGRPSKAMVRFLQGLSVPAGLKAAVFGTYGAQAKQLDVLARLLEEKGIEVVDRFACPGRDWFALGLLKRGRPNQDELRAAQAFARRAVGG